MPTYEYACTACDERVEAVQSFSDPPLTTCEACGGKLRRVFHPVGVVFKGSGFYSTDAKRKGSAPAPSGSSKDSKAASSESKSETKPEGKSGSKDSKASVD